MHRLNQIAALTLAAFVLGAVPVVADAKPCGASDNVATKHWKKYAELAVRYGCATTEEAPSAALEKVRVRCEADPMKSALIAAGMATFYERTYGDLPAKLKFKHPARLTFAAQHGSLLSTQGRTWIAPEPSEDDETTVIFQKLDGGSKASIEVCAHTADGKSKVVWQETVDSGKKNDVGHAFTKKLTKVGGAVISVTVDAKSVIKKLEYTIRLKRPGQGQINAAGRGGGKVTGFADVHNHQLSHLAWGGSWLWPGVEGPLTPCDGESHGVMKLTFAGKDAEKGLEFRRKHAERKNPRDWFHHLDTTHSHGHMEFLEQAHSRGLNLFVMSAVANREFTLAVVDKSIDKNMPLDETDSIKLQLRAAKALAAKYPWYQIAHDPAEARKIIAAGNLAVVLAVEYSDVLGQKHGEWRDQLEELYLMGVRSFVMAHERDSQFAGYAYHHGTNLALLGTLHKPGKGAGNFKKANPKGITPAGRELLRELASRGMLIEIDHVSRNTRRDIFSIVSGGKAGKLSWYPLLFSHTRPEALMPTPKELDTWVGKKGGYEEARMTGGYEGTGETPSTDEDVLWVRATGGIYGIRTGANALRTYEKSGVANTCHTSSRSIAQLYGYLLHRFGIATSLGTDFSGPTVATTGPRFGSEACSRLQKGDDINVAKDKPLGTLFDTKGLGHAGLMPDLIADLGNLGMDTANLERSAENFLRMWERAHDEKRGKLDVAGYVSLMSTDAPDDVRDGDELSRIKRDGDVSASSPVCPAGFQYDKRNGLNKDQCVKDEIVTGKTQCKLAITDKRANWKLVARPKRDICESTKGKKKTKDVECDGRGFKVDVREGKDICTKTETLKTKPSCPSGTKLRREKGKDVCK